MGLSPTTSYIIGMSSDSQLFYVYSEPISDVLSAFPEGYLFKDANELNPEYTYKLHMSLITRGAINHVGSSPIRMPCGTNRDQRIWAPAEDLMGWYTATYVTFSARSALARENKTKAINIHTTNTKDMQSLRCAGIGPDKDLLFHFPLDRGSWIAEIAGRDTKYGIKRHFIKGPQQGFREVSITPGTLYEVSIYRTGRYFFTLDNKGVIHPMGNQEAHAFHKWEGEGRLMYGPAL